MTENNLGKSLAKAIDNGNYDIVPLDDFDKKPKKKSDKNKLTFILKDAFENGNVEIISGVFDEKEEKIIEGTKYVYDNVVTGIFDGGMIVETMVDSKTENKLMLENLGRGLYHCVRVKKR